MKRLLSLLPSFLMAAVLWGAAPSDYYKSCEGKKAADLLSALCKVVGPHTNVGYSGLWGVYGSSDIDENGKIWDMYSTKRWTYRKEQCGSGGYTKVGDCYNREHSLPKSWFNDASPMYSDAFHIYPTDGKVNGQRSNHPYGECANGSSVAAANGVKPLGKLGASTFPGYSGTVFEPVDEYKGDFARSYFYMAAAYNDRIASWNATEARAMLDQNSYPVFDAWAVSLLLKWHRQDPVSQKEIDRNEAVSRYQGNRNPFIDHPDLAEHIWGDKKTEGWHSSAVQQPVINLPLNGSTVNFGVTAVNYPLQVPVRIEGMNLTSAVSLTVSSSDFSLSRTSVPAAEINGSAATVNVTFRSSTAKNATAVLTLSSGSLVTKVNLTASAINGIPAHEAAYVTEDSFTACWTGLAGDSDYTLTVSLNGTPISGYPVTVRADDGRHIVTGLEPGTTYTYQLSSATMKSNIVTVTTAVPQPSIDIMHYGSDSRVVLTAMPGEPSDCEEFWLETENIDSEITLSVNSPFELSTDKAEWTRTLILRPMEDRFYIRIAASPAGHYETFITATAGSYSTDDSMVEAIVTDPSVPTFIETFNPIGSTSYGNHVYKGSATTWNCKDVLFSASEGVDKTGAVRFGKTTSSSITTASAKPAGIGTISFQAKRFGTDDDAVIEVEYSADSGQTWQSAGKAEISSSAYTEFTFPVNVKGDNLIRLRQTSGERVNIDNFTVTDYAGQSAIEIVDDIQTWEAYSLGGSLVIENHGEASRFIVYNLEGMILADRTVSGSATLPLTPGFYIVSNLTDIRRVVVK
ncbi:endonuclease [Duncaniella muris]|nr:endonuclease [Duncaniella muris]